MTGKLTPDALTEALGWLERAARQMLHESNGAAVALAEVRGHIDALQAENEALRARRPRSRQIPTTQRRWLSVACTRCGAAPGSPCTTVLGDVAVNVHTRRQRAVYAAEGGDS